MIHHVTSIRRGLYAIMTDISPTYTRVLTRIQPRFPFSVNSPTPRLTQPTSIGGLQLDFGTGSELNPCNRGKQLVPNCFLFGIYSTVHAQFVPVIIKQISKPISCTVSTYKYNPVISTVCRLPLHIVFCSPEPSK